MNPRKKIEISQKLFEGLKERISEYGFNSVDECVEFVMGEFINQSEKKSISSDSLLDEDQIKERLRSLGYLEK